MVHLYRTNIEPRWVYNLSDVRTMRLPGNKRDQVVMEWKGICGRLNQVNPFLAVPTISVVIQMYIYCGFLQLNL